MASSTGKQFDLPGYGPIMIYKRRGSRSMRLSIKANGEAMVSLPAWCSYSAGLQFAAGKRDWLLSHRPALTILKDGQAVGKHHHLWFEPAEGLTAPRSSVTATSVKVRYPAQLTPLDPLVQSVASKACLRALRRQAEGLLPQRLAELAEKHGFSYASVKIKLLTSRWGSCDSHQRIVLNLYLMQLPWECIDYVLLHELTHTQILRHGPPFWAAMAEVLPNLTVIRRTMRTYKPVLQ